jgi:hypothetical protein
VPAALLSHATEFRLGESLVGGKIASHPAFIRFGSRISEEGGSDVPSGWSAGEPSTSPGLAETVRLGS